MQSTQDDVRSGLLAASLETQTLRIELQSDVATLGQEFRAETAALGQELRAELAATRNELKGEMVEIRGELRTGLQNASNETQTLRRETERYIAELSAKLDQKIDELKDSSVRETHRQTRQLFIGLISVMATMLAMLGGLLAITGKL